MTTNNLIAVAEITIKAPVDKVWEALITPQIIKKYMFGTTVTSDWKRGSPIVWRGEWKGKPYEDKGVILQLDPRKTLQYTHFSPLTGQPDVPENYHTVTIELTNKGGHTIVQLSQDNNSTDEEKEHSEKNWKMMLQGLKEMLEGSH